jgi:hypothetical protein
LEYVLGNAKKAGYFEVADRGEYKLTRVGASNLHFLKKLEIEGESRLPTIVFFRARDGQIEDLKVIPLESADLIHGFKELYDAIESYISGTPVNSSATTSARWAKGGAKLISL